MNTVPSLKDGSVPRVTIPSLIIPLLALTQAVAGVCCGAVQGHRARFGANRPGKSFPALEALFVTLVLLSLKLYKYCSIFCCCYIDYCSLMYRVEIQQWVVKKYFFLSQTLFIVQDIREYEL